MSTRPRLHLPSTRPGIHPVHAPCVAIGIEKATVVHESLVFRLVSLCPACADDIANEFVDAAAALDREAERHGTCLVEVRHRLAGEGFEELCADEHDPAGLVDLDAHGILARHVRIESESELRPERFRALKIGNGEIGDEHARVTHGNLRSSIEPRPE
jgi:hypothetical protein